VILVIAIVVSLLALLNVIILSNLIRNSTTTRTDSATNQRALPTPRQSPNHSPTRSRTTHNLRSRMMPMIASRLLPNRPVMPLLCTLTPLSKSANGKSQYRPKQQTSHNPIDLHKSFLLPSRSRGY
jgi:hypothetical protein